MFKNFYKNEKNFGNFTCGNYGFEFCGLWCWNRSFGRRNYRTGGRNCSGGSFLFARGWPCGADPCLRPFPCDRIKGEIEINEYSIYKYGLYVSTVVGSIKGISYKDINDIYNNLVIHSKKDIKISANDIAKELNSKPGNYLKKIFDDLELKILSREINNEYEDIVKYVVKYY